MGYYAIWCNQFVISINVLINNKINFIVKFDIKLIPKGQSHILQQIQVLLNIFLVIYSCTVQSKNVIKNILILTTRNWATGHYKLV